MQRPSRWRRGRLLHDGALGRFGTLVASTALTVVLGCTAGATRATEERPLELVVNVSPDTLDPRYVTDTVGVRASRLIHAGLVRLDPDRLEPVPYVARSWSWLDGRTLRVVLRDDVRFHSGARVSSADVVATLRAFGAPSVASRHARIVEPIAEVVEDGPDAVVVRLKRAHATLLTDLEVPILRVDQAFGPPDPEGTLDGLGPFRVGHFDRAALLLEPADGSPLPRPRHRVVVRTVRDENARALRLVAGRSDIALNVVSPTLLPAMESASGLFVRSRPGANISYLVVHHEHGVLADREVRRALSLAIDRMAITSSLFAGRAEAAAGIIPPTHWARANRSLQPLAHDEAMARRVLGGRRFRVTLLTSTERFRVSIARVLGQMFAEVGVEVEGIPLELGTMLARLNAGDFDLAMLTLPAFTEPHLLRHFFHSAFVPPAGANRGRVRDSELDAFLDEGGRGQTLEERCRLYGAAEGRLLDEMHAVPLWHEDQVAVTSARAREFLPSAEGNWLSVAAVGER